jgi:pimeloyl-ACP methyl ester carboxylesterase
MKLVAPLAALALLAVLALLAGCVSLRPFAEVRREQPAASFVTVDGRQVFVAQQGSGEPVILLHGFGLSSYSWRKIMPELAKSFHVIAPDLNGFGWTERPSDPAAYTREGQERLVLGVLDALGIARAQFVGHSYGGGLTLFIASRHPERMQSMVLVDSSAPTYANDRRTRLANLRPLNHLFLQGALRPRYIRKALAASVHDPALVTPELVQEYLDRLRVEGEYDAYYGLTARRGPPPAKDAPGEVVLERIGVPSLVVWGDDDRLVKLADGRDASRRLPDSHFEVLAGSGHTPMEEKPAELVRLLEPFLRAHRAAGPAAKASKTGNENALLPVPVAAPAPDPVVTPVVTAVAVPIHTPAAGSIPTVHRGISPAEPQAAASPHGRR